MLVFSVCCMQGIKIPLPTPSLLYMCACPSVLSFGKASCTIQRSKFHSSSVSTVNPSVAGHSNSNITRWMGRFAWWMFSYIPFWYNSKESFPLLCTFNFNIRSSPPSTSTVLPLMRLLESARPVQSPSDECCWFDRPAHPMCNVPAYILLLYVMQYSWIQVAIPLSVQHTSQEMQVWHSIILFNLASMASLVALIYTEKSQHGRISNPPLYL